MIRILALVTCFVAGLIWAASWWFASELERLIARDMSCGSAFDPCKIDDRSYNVLIPKGEGEYRTIVFFHGSGGSGAHVISNPSFVKPFLRDGYAVLAPSALDIGYAGNQRASGWVREGTREDRDDYRFVLDAIEDAASRFPIRREGMIFAGHSNGATFAWYLACADVPLDIEFVATVGGTPVRNPQFDCSRTLSGAHFLHTHGLQDEVVPPGGTIDRRSWGGWLGAEETSEIVADSLGCSGKNEQSVRRVARSLRWNGCTAGSSVRLDLTQNGHEIPEGWSDRVMNWHDELLNAE